MSPRPAPSRHDQTARQFLRAAVRLIDAYLDDQDAAARPARLRSIRFPAALEWLRTEDVIRLAAADAGTGASRKAFFNRWPTRDEFLPDALVYALVDAPVEEAPNDQAQQVPAAAASPVAMSQEIIQIADGLIASLRRHPRSYLTLHIGPLLTQHPALWQAVLPAMREGISAWSQAYAALLDDLGVALRPGWTPDRLALALQATLDGFLLRYRIMPDEYRTSSWEGAGIFADTVLALLAGVVDGERSGLSCAALLDRAAAPPG
ncbi:MAG TPA: hypothetical protein VGI64_01570 [Streptosporangiaceae bacterium]